MVSQHEALESVFKKLQNQLTYAHVLGYDAIKKVSAVDKNFMDNSHANTQYFYLQLFIVGRMLL